MSTFDLQKAGEENAECRTLDPHEIFLRNVPLGRRGASPLNRSISSTSKGTPNRPILGAFTKSGTSESLGPKSELSLQRPGALKYRRCGEMTRVMFKSFPSFRVRET
jgi:hypothetical protein